MIESLIRLFCAEGFLYYFQRNCADMKFLSLYFNIEFDIFYKLLLKNTPLLIVQLFDFTHFSVISLAQYFSLSNPKFTSFCLQLFHIFIKIIVNRKEYGKLQKILKMLNNEMQVGSMTARGVVFGRKMWWGRRQRVNAPLITDRTFTPSHAN